MSITMPTDTYLSATPEADPVVNPLLEQRAFSGRDDAPCSCPACCGGGSLRIIDAGETGLGPQAYLNADERAVGTVNGKASFSIDRAGLQLTGFDPGTMAPAPGWGGDLRIHFWMSGTTVASSAM